MCAIPKTEACEVECTTLKTICVQRVQRVQHSKTGQNDQKWGIVQRVHPKQTTPKQDVCVTTATLKMEHSIHTSVSDHLSHHLSKR